MTFVEYFKEKAIFIIINLFVLIVTSYLLNGLNVSSYAIFLVCILNFLSNVSFFIYDYFAANKDITIIINNENYFNEILNKCLDDESQISVVLKTEINDTILKAILKQKSRRNPIPIEF